MTKQELILTRYIQSLCSHERNGLSSIPCNENYALKVAQSFLREGAGKFTAKGGTKSSTKDAIFYLDGLCVVRWHLCDQHGESVMCQMINLGTDEISAPCNGFDEYGTVFPKNQKVDQIIDYFENK